MTLLILRFEFKEVVIFLGRLIIHDGTFIDTLYLKLEIRRVRCILECHFLGDLAFFNEIQQGLLECLRTVDLLTVKQCIRDLRIPVLGDQLFDPFCLLQYFDPGDPSATLGRDKPLRNNPLKYRCQRHTDTVLLLIAEHTDDPVDGLFGVKYVQCQNTG